MTALEVKISESAGFCWGVERALARDADARLPEEAHAATVAHGARELAGAATGAEARRDGEHAGVPSS